MEDSQFICRVSLSRFRPPTLAAALALVLLAVGGASVAAVVIEVNGRSIDTDVVQKLDKDARGLQGLLPTIKKVTDAPKLLRYVESEDIEAVKKLRREVDSAGSAGDGESRQAIRDLMKRVAGAEKSLRSAGEAIDTRIEELNAHEKASNDYVVQQLTAKKLDVDQAVGELGELKNLLNKRAE